MWRTGSLSTCIFVVLTQLHSLHELTCRVVDFAALCLHAKLRES